MSIVENNKGYECYIDTSPTLSINDSEIILNQMRKSVCKIEIGDSKGTGFFT